MGARPVATSQRGRFFTSARSLAIALTAVTFLLYWRTAAPTVLPGDSGEFQFAAWGFWLAHPTGYPLYLLLGGLWQHLFPVGDPAFRLNLFSALCSALTVGALFAVAFHVTRSRSASAIAALTFAFSPLFWSQATRAEVYALHSLLIALLCWLGLNWRDTLDKKYAVLFALTFGLSLAHHRTTILLIPAFAALFADRLMAYKRDRAFGRRVLFYAALAALPLILYLYVPLRAGATPYATIELDPAPPIVVMENSPVGWLGMVLGTGFSGELDANASTMDALLSVPERILTQLNPFALLGAILGIIVLFWQRRFDIAAFLLFGILAFAFFNSIYQIGDIADYDTPIYFFASIALAAGIAFVVGLLRAHTFTRHSTLPAIALLALFALLPLQNFFNNFFAQDRSLHFNTRDAWQTILASDLPDDAILISNDRDELTPLYYFQLVEGARPDWVGVFPKIAVGARYENVVALVSRLAASSRPIYALKPIPSLGLRYPVKEVETGRWQVFAVAPGLPRTASNARLGDELQVRGFSVLSGVPFAGERVTLELQYVPLVKLARNYTTSVQLFDAEGNKVAQGNDHVPGEGEYPSSKWRVGETIQDQFDIELDPNLRAGIYKLMLNVYDPSSGDELGELTEIGELEILE